MNLEELTATEFDDELYEQFGDVKTFRAFLDPSVIHRTREYLSNLRDSLDAQLVKYRGSDTSDPGWVDRTTRLRTLVSSRLHMAQARIREAEAASRGTSANQIREWKRCLHRVLEVVDECGDDGVCAAVDALVIPFGNMTMFEWLERRLEKDPTRTGLAA